MPSDLTHDLKKGVYDMVLPQRYIERDHYTEEDYLCWEQDAPIKSEYVQGKIRAMSGGTEAHAGIPVNLGAELRTALRGRGCRVLSSDMKVWTANAYYYPDLTVVCGLSKFRGASRTVVTNPIMVVEVLSAGTEAKDRGEKFIRYQQIETLQSYLLVSQSEPRVELFNRGQNGQWDYTTAVGLESAILMPALEIELQLVEIFAQVDFASETEDE